MTGTDLTQSNSAFEVLLKDLRSDGIITALDGVMEVISGNINISGAEPTWSVTFDLILADNTTVIGFYNGSFFELPAE